MTWASGFAKVHCVTSFPKSAIGPMAASMELKTLTAEWFRCAVLAHGADQVDEECEHVKER